jgi:hypothetical protein
MTKDDKARIAAAWQEYSAAAAQCSNVLYNESQSSSERAKLYGELVRNHDAKRNSMAEILKRHGLISR